MRLLITRPREDAEPLAALLGERGIETALEPLMSIIDADTPDPDLSGVQAVLITSANSIRAFARRVADRDIAVCAVGDASARAALDLGFDQVSSAAGEVYNIGCERSISVNQLEERSSPRDRKRPAAQPTPAEEAPKKKQPVRLRLEPATAAALTHPPR